MSEFMPSSDHEKFEVLKTPEHLSLPTAEQAEPLRAGEADPTQKLEAARQTIEQTSDQNNPLERLAAAEKSAEETGPRMITRAEKKAAKQRQQLRIQRQLPAPKRALSRVIHQPVVRAISDASSSTISRPSGLLGGGLVAFLGTTSYLYLAKHLGFTYNYLVFLLLFVGGFAIGLILELLVHTTLKNHHTE
jgi:hypothetical protein